MIVSSGYVPLRRHDSKHGHATACDWRRGRFSDTCWAQPQTVWGCEALPSKTTRMRSSNGTQQRTNRRLNDKLLSYFYLTEIAGCLLCVSWDWLCARVQVYDEPFCDQVIWMRNCFVDIFRVPQLSASVLSVHLQVFIYVSHALSVLTQLLTRSRCARTHQPDAAGIYFLVAS